VDKRCVLVRIDSAERLAAALEQSARAAITVAIDAESAVGIARTRPQLVEAARAAFAEGRLAAVLSCAHGGEAALFGADELADELRLNEETLQLVFGATFERRGFSGAADNVVALEEAGVDFVLGDVATPVRVGERLLVLPVTEATPDDASGGVHIVAAPAWAAELTPPWVPAGERPDAGESPPALRALAELGEWCMAAFGLRRVPGVGAAALVDEGWKLERFPARARLPLVRRRGLVAARKAWVAAYEWCDVLAVEARVPGLAAHATEALPAMVLPTLRAVGEAHGAGEPMARAEAAYEELRSFGFLGGLRWRALLSSLRDAFALLSARREVDWTVVAPAPQPCEQPMLRLVEPAHPVN
jgi:hypothetical protein